MHQAPLAGLDQEHFGLASERRLRSCPEGSRYIFDREGLPINPRYDTLVSVAEKTADEGIAMPRSLSKIGESAASPLLDLDLLQLRKVALRSKAVSARSIWSLVWSVHISTLNPSQLNTFPNLTAVKYNRVRLQPATPGR
ncbi:hypothetical protein CesoFtcFv8_026444 [Champsocephalus esox]|uniref:Uncharacterized protein n=1 Tax=Champsocephalus esox TaxID=159716 RepID=A0AAN8B336_9TELE|nr:hypothetical protein CesoFtcFv8_026444 [Champsocephalus esox]